MSDLKIALYGKKTHSTALEDFMPPLFEALAKKSVKIQIEESFFKTLKEIPELDFSNCSLFNSHSELWQDLDLFFTFGGDGTILSAISLVQDSNVPIVGVNTGRLGYLASINKKSLLPNLEAILAKNFRQSPRTLIRVETSNGNQNIAFPYALNELSLMRKETTSMITIDTYINGELLNSFWADGLIVATPTGSTGYSLSCNGPIVSPDNRNFIITPIAPHNLNVRPIVIPDTEKLHLKIHSRVPEYSLSLDSRITSLSTEVEIDLLLAKFKVNIVELNENSYLETLREKLFWGSDTRNKA